jgi:hypothetical protein
VRFVRGLVHPHGRAARARPVRAPGARRRRGRANTGREPLLHVVMARRPGQVHREPEALACPLAIRSRRAESRSTFRAMPRSHGSGDPSRRSGTAAWRSRPERTSPPSGRRRPTGCVVRAGREQRQDAVRTACRTRARRAGHPGGARRRCARGSCLSMAFRRRACIHAAVTCAHRWPGCCTNVSPPVSETGAQTLESSYRSGFMWTNRPKNVSPPVSETGSWRRRTRPCRARLRLPAALSART